MYIVLYETMYNDNIYFLLYKKLYNDNKYFSYNESIFLLYKTMYDLAMIIAKSLPNHTSSRIIKMFVVIIHRLV